MFKDRRGMGLAGSIIRVLSANLWVTIIGFVSSIIFPRILSIDDYALYHTFTLYLTYITILHLGFPSGMVINYAGTNYEEIDKRQYKTEIKIIGIILAGFTLVAFTLSIVLHNRMLAYIALAIIPYDLIGSYKALLQAWSKFKEFGIVSTVVATTIPIAAFLFYVIVGVLPGNVYICIYLGVYWIVTILIIREIEKKIKGVKANPIRTKVNWDIERTGLVLVLGNYINTLFVSADKQFIKWFYDNQRFAFYSFGMSMQSMMTVFITSIAQPLFPAMAQGKFKDEEYNGIKEFLIVFGSLSGCAYFATSFVVRNFITKYVDSLIVVGIYFVVFPALAVVNCLYINLYKIKNLMKQYIVTLAGILSVAVVLNSLAILFYPDYTGVAIATTITYYIWFLLGFKQFKFLKLRVKDVEYLLFYTGGFFIITRSIANEFVGVAVYVTYIIALVLIFYREKVRMMIKYTRR